QTRSTRDWSSDVCSSDLEPGEVGVVEVQDVAGGPGRDRALERPVAERAGGARGGLVAAAGRAGEPVQQRDLVAHAGHVSSAGSSSEARRVGKGGDDRGAA